MVESSSPAMGLTDGASPEEDTGHAERGVLCQSTEGWEVGITDQRGRKEAEQQGRSEWGVRLPISAVSKVPGNIISGATISSHGDLRLSREVGMVEGTGGYLEVSFLAPNSGMPGNGASSISVGFLQIAAPNVLDRMPERTLGVGMVKDVQREAAEVWERAPELVWSEGSPVCAIFAAAPTGHMQTLPNLGFAVRLPPPSPAPVTSESRLYLPRWCPPHCSPTLQLGY